MSSGLNLTDSTLLASSRLTTSLHWPCYCTEANLCMLCLLFAKCMNVGDPVIKRVGSPINRFNLATFLYLSQVRTWISNVICRSLCDQWYIYIYILWERRLKMNLSSISYVNRIVTVSKQIVWNFVTIGDKKT